MLTSTERVRQWRAANPEKARALYEKQDKVAARQRASEWSRANPERRKQIKAEYDQRRSADPKTWAKHMVSAIRCRCRKAGIPFNLTAADLLAVFPMDFICPAIGIPIKFGSRKLSGNSPSVDRIIPSLGYVAGNVLVISNRANVMKQDCTDPAEMRRLADYVERHARVGLDALAEGARARPGAANPCAGSQPLSGASE
jgi:hypothetical protein